jgi:hypothetical protein
MVSVRKKVFSAIKKSAIGYKGMADAVDLAVLRGIKSAKEAKK